jgi:hypothetical protein
MAIAERTMTTTIRTNEVLGLSIISRSAVLRQRRWGARITAVIHGSYIEVMGG